MKKINLLAFSSLIIATILFAIGPATVKLLVERGGEFGIRNPGSISFCNVLFIGNLCAGLVVGFSYGLRGIFRELISLSNRTKIYLFFGSILTALYPSLIFIALEHTTVVNLVLLSRFNGIVYLIFAILFLKQKIQPLEIVGYTIMALAVGVLVFINNMGKIQTGDILILLATVFFAINEIISKKILPNCSIKTYVFARNFFSSIIFFVIAIILFGAEHFAQAFEGQLWILMIVYAGFAVVLAQIFWLTAIKTTPPIYVANVRLFDPVFSLAFAYLLLNEKLDITEWIVLGAILIGVLIPKIGLRKKPVKLSPISIDTSLVGK